jgi:copper homeostasis protein (lipoprotein)
MSPALQPLPVFILVATVWLAFPSVESFGGGDSDQPMVMRGMYRYMADAALFTDCRSGRSFPVALEGDNRALEQAYLMVRKNPGEALLVTLEGRIVQRMPMEGPRPVPTLLPEKFLGISPEEKCERKTR